MTSPADAPPPTRVLLIGMMGSGKTTVGKALAARTGWPYLDNDELVRRATGTATPDVLAERGVGDLRAVESLALTEALRTEPPVIASVAGGVVDDPADLDRLRGGGYVVWLRADLDTLARRVGTGAGRPWLAGDVRGSLERLYAGRAERYAAAATQIVDVDSASPDDVAAAIVDGIRAAG